VAYYLYDLMPDPVPTHWNIRGEADGFTAKPWGAYITSLMTAGIYLLFLVLPLISPKGFRMENFAKVWDIIKVIFVVMMLLINIAASLSASGLPFSMEKMIPILVGAMFILLGNYFGKVTKNYFVGIRTPWTLSNDEVWLHTHRLGGKLFVAGGFLLIIESLLVLPSVFPIVTILMVAGVPIVYSYVIYRRIVGRA